MKVEIYTTPTCGYCHQAKKYFQSKNVPYVEHDVASDRQAAQRMVQLTGQMGVPVITIEGENIIGFDLPRIQQLLSSRSSSSGAKFGARVADAERYTNHKGAYVGEVCQGSTADIAGIKAGDTIIGINDDSVFTGSELKEIMHSLCSGTQLKVLFVRDDKTMQARVTV
jgi:glutaredoxin 3